jgi:hypothetical protein
MRLREKLCLCVHVRFAGAEWKRASGVFFPSPTSFFFSSLRLVLTFSVSCYCPEFFPFFFASEDELALISTLFF